MIRTKILFLSLCAMGILAAVFGAAQMWTDFLDWDVFLKLMGTLLLLGTELSFLMAVDYDLPSSRRKWLLLGLVVVSVLSCGMVTLQIWVQFFQWAIFVKLLATLGIAFLLLGFLLAVAEDFGSNKRLKDRNFID
ncbi:MAG: hypothetical protein HYU57_05590 [Micavibrio aeruginosavorus]|nr:hypothetical protein [Micavibrio aeruginosavorus]